MGNSVAILSQRPLPPEDLVSVSGMMAPDRFEPAPELLAWLYDAYLEDEGPLFNPDHAHLTDAAIGVLWTNALNTRHGRRIVGQAEIPERMGGKSGKWAKARMEQQLIGWFGAVPDFLLTFDAAYVSSMADTEFAALVDHELYHCAQATDSFGMPRFHRLTGKPIWTLRGHDVEEFVGVVRRFGIEAAGESATDMVIAAAQAPQISSAKLAQACGNCVKQAA